ncbi:MAG: hypothetical protein KGN36_00840 [Acidobacteriota bacterium]|nr:hypothetical protein [Acidobacteriota bacterium]
MKLVDLRKLAIKQQQRIRFQARNGMECVLNERGVAQVPALNRVPDFDLEQELSAASTFVLETVAAGPKQPSRTRTVGREELSALVSAAPAGAAHHDEHDDE